MYQAERAAGQTPLARLLRGGLPAVSRNVWCLGLTSLFTDISSEMVASILPAYLVLQLGLSPMAFGAIDGLYHGVGSLVRWLGGVTGDRTHRHKEWAALGYGLSACCRIGMLVVGSTWTAVTALVAVDRVAKGFRTAPRDALISLSTPTSQLATAFGVHRALDAGGALLGPIVAFAVLATSPRAFDQIFVISFSFALVGLAVILLFVENATGELTSAQVERRRGGLLAPLGEPQFRGMVVIACLLALATVSDAFVYLLLQRHGQFGPRVFPLLAAATAVSYVVLAVPAGRLADRIGRGPVFIAGHAALLGVYAMLWQSDVGAISAAVCVLMLGSYYAMTDGVLAAAASAVLDPPVRGTGLALLGTAVSVSRLAASMLFGWAWSRYDPNVAVGAFAIALSLAIALAVASRHRLEGSAT